ncbi:unnamed protein product, partial [Cyprideis torosa]
GVVGLRSEHYDESFLKTVTPFHELEIDFVRDCPPDPMHFLFANVVSRFISYSRGEVKGVHRKFSLDTERRMNDLIPKLKETQPKGYFARVPREVWMHKFFKCTEYKQFVMYTGLFMFEAVKTNLSVEYLNSFYCLFSLSHLACYKDRSPVFRDLLMDSVQGFLRAPFPRKFFTLCSHLLLHLPEFCEMYGSAMDFSAFPFESALGLLRSSVSGFYKPLQQVVKRISERETPYLTPKRREIRDKREAEISFDQVSPASTGPCNKS